MLYQWKFSIIHKDGNILQEDTIIAPTAADADYLYKHIQNPWPSEMFYGVPVTLKIECLGEIKNEIPQQNRVTVLFKSINISDTYTYALDMPVTVNGELIHWGFGVNNRSIAIVKILDDVISTNPALSSQPILISRGQVMEIMPSQLRFI